MGCVAGSPVSATGSLAHATACSTAASRPRRRAVARLSRRQHEYFHRAHALPSMAGWAACSTRCSALRCSKAESGLRTAGASPPDTNLITIRAASSRTRLQETQSWKHGGLEIFSVTATMAACRGGVRRKVIFGGSRRSYRHRERRVPGVFQD